MKNGVTKILFVNSLNSSGIGDFGNVLYSAINSVHLQKTQIHTDNSWGSFLSNWNTIFKFPGKVLMNLGFTSYGKSPFINFANFFLIFLYSKRFSGRMQVILHDSPDITIGERAGYEHFKLIKLGGGVATRLLRGLQVHVFSVMLFDILRNEYKFKNVYYHPFPCLIASKSQKFSENSKAIVISIGYIAPYKGLELIPGIKKALPNVDFIMSSASHPILSKTAKGSKYLHNLLCVLKESGVDLRDYIQEEEIAKLTSERRVIGILPYVVTSGSSYAVTFLMGLGIPVLATDLPEFRALYEHGAGIVLCERGSDRFADEIIKLMNHPELYQESLKRNIQYCAKYSLQNLIFDLNI